MKQQRILPADVYDTLELVAEAFGGIGAGKYAILADGRRGFGFEEDVEAPVCAMGCAYFVEETTEMGEMEVALRAADINVHSNDKAVRRINERRYEPLHARVPFADWCAELGVVRGS